MSINNANPLGTKSYTMTHKWYVEAWCKGQVQDIVYYGFSNGICQHNVGSNSEDIYTNCMVYSCPIFYLYYLFFCFEGLELVGNF